MLRVDTTPYSSAEMGVNTVEEVITDLADTTYGCVVEKTIALLLVVGASVDFIQALVAILVHEHTWGLCLLGASLLSVVLILCL